MLGRTAEGDLCLEDGDGIVTLDMEETVRYSLPLHSFSSPKMSSKENARVPIDETDTRPRLRSTSFFQSFGTGMFTEGCLVLVEGEYTDEEIMKVIEMGHPPSEKRAVAR